MIQTRFSLWTSGATPRYPKGLPSGRAERYAKALASRRPLGRRNDFVIDFPDRQVLNFNYQIVQLNRLNWRDFLQQKNPVAAALMSKLKIEQQDRPKVKAQCLRLMVTLKLDPARTSHRRELNSRPVSSKMHLISGFVDSYLKLNSQEESIFQSELSTMELQEREQIMQITTSWEEKGRLEGQVTTILRLLKRKFGTLDSELTERIKSLEPSQLDSLTENLLDFQSLDNLLNWLSNA